jgi:hypothetical protein
MSGQHQTTHVAQSPPVQVAAHTHLTTPQERQERRQRVQTHGRSAVTRGIADAIGVKARDMFFLSEPTSRVPLGDTYGYGLYYEVITAGGAMPIQHGGREARGGGPCSR